MEVRFSGKTNDSAIEKTTEKIGVDTKIKAKDFSSVLLATLMTLIEIKNIILSALTLLTRHRSTSTA